MHYTSFSEECHSLVFFVFLSYVDTENELEATPNILMLKLIRVTQSIQLGRESKERRPDFSM